MKHCQVAYISMNYVNKPVSQNAHANGLKSLYIYVYIYIS